MNAYELADMAENACCAYQKEIAAMLRQQQNEIGFYKQDADCYKLKCASQQAEIETLKERLRPCQPLCKPSVCICLERNKP